MNRNINVRAKTRMNERTQCAQIHPYEIDLGHIYGGKVTPALTMLVSPDETYQPSHTEKKMR